MANKTSRKEIERDIMIRALLEDKKRDAKVVAEAVWESGLEVRDALAQRKREDKNRKQEAKTESSVIKTVRAEKLAELYRRDEEIYEDELNAMGLAFTRSEF